ncbi:MAG: PTS system mannose/fructose/sorbose family transporter subunit IID [Erysipelotrichaceae bacterium]|nr:PTS system mannose/fructose/sorbose family transporter subunit IID [Erysipelotrichaceae bacterium]
MARTNAKVSKKALKTACSRHANTLQHCWNYERMQATGFAYSIAPVIRELYDTEEEVCEQLKRHLQFYNTNPTPSNAILGASIALEEQYQTEASDSIKVALMGPLAGIGDAVFAVLIKPITYIVATALANEGSYLSLVVMIVPFLLFYLAKYPLFWYGYKKSAALIEDLNTNSALAKFTKGAQIVGLTVVGGFVPSMVGVSLALTYTKEIDGVEKSVAIQDTLDKAFPALLPVLIVYLCYWCIKVKKFTPTKTILILLVIGFVGGALGILA